MKKRKQRQSTSPESPTDVAAQAVASIEPERREFPLPAHRRSVRQTVIQRSTLNRIHAHGRSSLDAEVCGVLVGTICRDSFGEFLVIDASIAGQHTAANANHVTFTAETWEGIQAELEEKYSDRRIVGWYHTHPGFGIFLSEMDVFIHRSFFDLPWQVALVYDPRKEEEGLFAYRDDQLLREEMLVDEDEPVGDRPVAAAADAPVAAAHDDLAARVRTLEKRQWLLIVLLIIVAAIALVWPIALQMLQMK